MLLRMHYVNEHSVYLRQEDSPHYPSTCRSRSLDY